MTYNSTFGVTAWACAALAASSLCLKAELKPEDIYSTVLPSIVSLEVENVAGKHFVGSGFLGAGDNLAVTAWHVIYDARHVEARFSDGRRAQVLGVVDKNEALDLALIKLSAGSRAQIKLNCATPRIGSRIYLVGSPRGFDFSISEGLVSQVRTVDGVKYYQVSCPISPGDSGEPVLNDRGEVIGVISWRKADAENMGFAVPSAAIARLKTTLPPIAWVEATSISPPPEPLRKAGQASRLSPATAALLDRLDACTALRTAPFLRANATVGEPTATNSFSSFLHLLSGHAGEHLSVTIKEPSGKERRFSFEVPEQPWN